MMNASQGSTPARVEGATVAARLPGGPAAIVARKRLGRIAAFNAIRRAFSGRSRATRFHVLGRFLTCPYLRTLRHLTPGSHVLDVGAGHGILAVLAVEAGAASITTIEPDLRKTLTTFQHPRVRVVAGLIDAIVGHYDLVTLYDVLYRIPIDDRDRLLEAIRGRLRPGGLLLVKEMDPDQRLKSAWNRSQEWVSDHFLGLTMGSGFYYESPSQVLARLQRCGFERCAMEDIGSFYPHAHVSYTARAPSSAPKTTE
jgi:cyclopropane fatty-acyl-phospholipid synthase-like methyltransferase